MTAISATSRYSLPHAATTQAAAADTSAPAVGSNAGKPASAAAAKTAQAALQAALQAAAARPKAASAANTLDQRQAQLATDLRAAMAKAGVGLSGTVEFSVSSAGKVETKGTDADKAATASFLKADKSAPSFASRIAMQAQDALKLSSGLQQSAAISQAARYGGRSGGVMSLYTSLLQQAGPTSAVFSLGATSSALVYPGSLAAKA